MVQLLLQSTYRCTPGISLVAVLCVDLCSSTWGRWLGPLWPGSAVFNNFPWWFSLPSRTDSTEGLSLLCQAVLSACFHFNFISFDHNFNFLFELLVRALNVRSSGVLCYQVYHRLPLRKCVLCAVQDWLLSCLVDCVLLSLKAFRWRFLSLRRRFTASWRLGFLFSFLLVEFSFRNVFILQACRCAFCHFLLGIALHSSLLCLPVSKVFTMGLSSLSFVVVILIILASVCLPPLERLISGLHLSFFVGYVGSLRADSVQLLFRPTWPVKPFGRLSYVFNMGVGRTGSRLLEPGLCWLLTFGQTVFFISLSSPWRDVHKDNIISAICTVMLW